MNAPDLLDEGWLGEVAWRGEREEMAVALREVAQALPELKRDAARVALAEELAAGVADFAALLKQIDPSLREDLFSYMELEFAWHKTVRALGKWQDSGVRVPTEAELDLI